jgi:hypothetical protein
VLVTSGRKLRTSEGLLVLFITYAGLYSSRNIPISSILLAMIVGPWLPDPKLVRGFSLRMSAVELSLTTHVWPVVATVAVFLVALNGGWVGPSSVMDAHFDGKRMPVQAVNYLEAHDIQGPILGPDYWGGYFIYRLYPRARVVLDDRHDLYGAQFLRSYLRMMHVERGWDEFLQDHSARCVVLPRNAPLATIFSETAAWRAIYADDVAIVFVKSSETFPNLHAER